MGHPFLSYKPIFLAREFQINLFPAMDPQAGSSAKSNLLYQGQSQYIFEPGQPFGSKFVLYRLDIGLIKQTMNRTSRCNKVDAVRLYASVEFTKEQRCVVPHFSDSHCNLTEFSFCVCLYMQFMSICQSVYLADLLSVSFCLSVHLSLCLSVYLSTCLYICLSVLKSVYLSICIFVPICLFVYLSICLFVYLSICLSVYPSICLSVYLSI